MNMCACADDVYVYAVCLRCPVCWCMCCAGYTRLLYRMSMDFMGWVRYVPGIQDVWKGVAGQVRDSLAGGACDDKQPVWWQ